MPEGPRVNGETSFWLHDTVQRIPRPPLPGDREYDVAIVGGGFTGLWTAYWLTQVAPDARVVVLEAEHVGYGASGRNGGWLSGKTVGLRRQLARGPRGREGVVDLQRACFEAVPEVLELVDKHGYDVDAAEGGYLQVARAPAELTRIRSAVRSDREWGLTEDDVRLIDADDLKARVNVHGALGATFSPHSACLNPAKLVLALASIVEDAGVVIHESTPVTELAPGCVTTTRGRVTAPVSLRATEGYTSTLPGGWAEMLPMNSSMIVTDPLSEDDLSTIGWAGREGLSGASHRYFYSQRTADNRIALGGRGLPYRYGSRLDSNGHLDPWTVKQLRRVLRELFPDIADLPLQQAWCGPLGVPRDWSPSVRFDRTTGLGQAGGYVGQGVAAAYVAGRSLAELVAGHDTRHTNLPWVNRSSRRWEPEPLRFLGAYSMYGLYQVADVIERRRLPVRTSAFARLADKVSGRY